MSIKTPAEILNEVLLSAQIRPKSLKKLSEVLGVSSPALYKISNGKAKISALMAEKINAAFPAFSKSYLIGDPDIPDLEKKYKLLVHPEGVMQEDESKYSRMGIEQRLSNIEKQLSLIILLLKNGKE